MSPIKSIISGLSGSSVSKVGIGSTGIIAGIAATSTGSIFNPGNGYRYHIFTQPGNLFVISAGYVDYMVVGGGGGGAIAGAGPTPQPDLFKGAGGGSGGVVQNYLQLFPAGTYTINVGTGGRSTTGDGISGNPTFITSPGISSITAFGGAGGSGGGTGGTSGLPQGYAGGSRQGYPIPVAQGSGGGGGGGAGGYGNPSWGASPAVGGQGGDGVVAFNADTGVPSSYGYSLPSPGRWFAGGGGGGGPGGGGPAPAGGSGGASPSNGTDGNANTGGGGGGTAYGRIAGSGGSGIVIIRYKLTTN